MKSKPVVDPHLEEVGEEHAFEIEYDEETNEVVLVHHYRNKWGDGFDADIEQGLNIEENSALISTLMEILEEQKKQVIAIAVQKGVLVEKLTPEPIESNPLKDNKVQ